MTCDDFQKRFSSYLDGEMTQWSRWKVMTHVRFCPRCASVMRDLQSVDLCLIGSVEAHPAPEYLTGAVMRRLPAMPPAWKRRRAVPWTVGLAVAGAQAFALFGVYWWGYSKGASVKPLADQATGVQVFAPSPVESGSGATLVGAGEPANAPANGWQPRPLWSQQRFPVVDQEAVLRERQRLEQQRLEQQNRRFSPLLTRPVMAIPGAR